MRGSTRARKPDGLLRFRNTKFKAALPLVPLSSMISSRTETKAIPPPQDPSSLLMIIAFRGP